MNINFFIFIGGANQSCRKHPIDRRPDETKADYTLRKLREKEGF